MDNQSNTQSQNKALAASDSRMLAFFEVDEEFAYVLKKTERLTSALYLITSFFDLQEPLRWKLRSLGSDLLSASLALKDGHRSASDRLVANMSELILEIESLLSVSRNAGLMTDANHSIIHRELLNLISRISPSNRLTEEFFATPLPQRTEASSSQIETRPEALPERERTSPTVERVSENTASHKGHLLDDFDLPSAKVILRHKTPRASGIVSVKKNKRQTVILDLLKRQKEIMIKDVSPLISGVSEKTIQRELLNMVKSGVLKKEGEKRWSRYSLA
jgi:hypothetical protein